MNIKKLFNLTAVQYTVEIVVHGGLLNHIFN